MNKRAWGMIVLLVLMGAGTVGVKNWVSKDPKETGAPKVRVIAHRGGAAHAPENTVAALERAIEFGAPWAELDLRMTRDGVVVVLHDEDLLRTAGLEKAVCQMDFEQLRRVDVGGWFSSDYAGELVPTLEEVLELAKGKISLLLELKHTTQPQMMLQRVMEQIRGKDMEEMCLLGSAELELLAQSKELAPEVKTIYIGQMWRNDLQEFSYLDGYSICLSELTREDVVQAHLSEREIYTWTVNELWEMERAMLLGADGLVTDNPKLAQEFLDRRLREP